MVTITETLSNGNTRVREFQGDFWEYTTRDAAGREVRYENSRGQITTHTYDAAGTRTTTVVVA